MFSKSWIFSYKIAPYLVNTIVFYDFKRSVGWEAMIYIWCSAFTLTVHSWNNLFVLTIILWVSILHLNNYGVCLLDVVTGLTPNGFDSKNRISRPTTAVSLKLYATEPTISGFLDLRLKIQWKTMYTDHNMSRWMFQTKILFNNLLFLVNLQIT